MSTEQTRLVVAKYFADLERGDLDSALSALADDIDFELPADKWNEIIPYLGRHVGIEAVKRAFEVRGQTTEILGYEMRDLRTDGDIAFAVIYTKGAHTGTREQFEIEDAHRLVVENGKIVSWKVYFDPNGEIAAFAAGREERLFAAVRWADRDEVANLIRFGADVDHREPGSGLTPLMIAAGKADPKMVELLIAEGADVFTTDSGAGATALHKACQGGSLEVVRALVEAGAFVDSVAATTGHTPLMDALWYKFPDIAGYLLDRGAGLNLSTHYGFSLKEHFEYELNVNTIGKDRLLLAEEYLKQRQASDEGRIAAQRLMAAVTTGDTEAVRRRTAARTFLRLLEEKRIDARRR
jgi:ketosteroid isomerase-like protein